jgi:hypothetical protein
VDFFKEQLMWSPLLFERVKYGVDELPEAVIEKLRGMMEPGFGEYRLLATKKVLQGYINGDVFLMRKISYSRTIFKPILAGNVTYNKTRSVLEASFRLSLPMYLAYFALFSVAGLAPFGLFVILPGLQALSWEVLAAFVVPGLLLMLGYLGFWIEVKAIKAILARTFHLRIVS